jgi:double-strand break repair protein MRE11
VIDDVILVDAAEDDGFDVNDRMAVSKFLKSKVSRYVTLLYTALTIHEVDELIVKADAIWNERNERAKQQGEPELPRMLPLIRLKVRSQSSDLCCLLSPCAGGHDGGL